MPAVKPAKRTAKAQNVHYAKPTAANTCMHTRCATCNLFIQENTHPKLFSEHVFDYAPSVKRCPSTMIRNSDPSPTDSSWS